MLRAFHGAIRYIHERRDHHMGGFVHSCDDCIKAAEAGKNSSNCHHVPLRVMDSGDPTKSPVYRDFAKQIGKDRIDYIEEGAFPLHPSEVRLFRRHLLSTSSLKNLQTYVMMLLGIRLFLRFDEFSKITVDSFDTGLHSSPNGKLNALCISICGKSDKVVHKFLIFASDDCPEFCPLRHLLLYVYLTKMKGGYLFPNEKELNNPPADGIFRTKCGGQSVRETLAELYNIVVSVTVVPFNKRLGNDRWLDFMKVGTHSYRKTGWLFAVLGGGNESSIMESSRHASVKNAIKYRLDAETQNEVYNLSTQGEQLVPIWRMNKKFASRVVRGTVEGENMTSLSILEWAKAFVENPNYLGYRQGSYQNEQSSLCDRLLRIKFSESGPIHNSPSVINHPYEFSEARVLAECADIIKHKLSDFPSLAEKYAKTLDHLLETQTENTNAVHAGPRSANTPPSVVVPTKKKTRGGTNTFVESYQGRIKETKVLSEKVDLIEEMFQNAPPFDNVLTEKGRTYKQKCKKIHKCLNICFQGNKHSFVNRFLESKATISKFKCVATNDNGACIRSIG